MCHPCKPWQSSDFILIITEHLGKAGEKGIQKHLRQVWPWTVEAFP